ncbi:MAG: DegV family protein, partial [Anaerolineales bacterium]|nr:DegV family protein [Anaerolineales bacterium]
NEFAEQISAQFNCAELHVMDAGPVIGTHTGPGTLGIVFYKSSAVADQ